MKSARESSLWLAAFGASIALHGVLGTAFALAPRPQTTEPTEVRVTLHTVDEDVPSRANKAAALEPAEPEAILARPQTAATVAADVARQSTAIEPARDDGPAIAEDVSAPATLERLPPNLSGSLSPEIATAAELTPVADAVQEPAIEFIAPRPEAVASAVVQSETLRTPLRDGDGVRPVEAAIPLTPSTIPLSAVSIAEPDVKVAAIEAAPAVVPVLPEEIPAGATTSSPVAPEVFVTAEAAAERVSAISSPVEPRETMIGPDRRSAAENLTGNEDPAVLSASVPAAGSAIVSPRVGDRAGAEMALAPLRPDEQPLSAQPLIDPWEQVKGIITRQSRKDCFLALADPAGDTIRVDGYSEHDEQLRRLRRELAAVSIAPVTAREHLVTRAQCEALSFARSQSDSPEADLPIFADTTEIRSGAELSGEIRNLKRSYVYLVIIDDEGIVQEIGDDSLWLIDRHTIGFRAPFTLTGGPVGTVQLLLSIASDRPLLAIAEHEHEEAGRYFTALQDEIKATGLQVEVGVAGFIVR